jgi:hypothetical protein
MIFRPDSVSEVVGLGRGMGAALGHSLMLTGDVWDDRNSYPNPLGIFCKGNLRIEEKNCTEEEQGKNLGVVQLITIDGTPDFNAALSVRPVDFASIRQLFVDGGEGLEIELFTDNHASLVELIKDKKVVAVASASIAHRYRTIRSVGE